MNETQKTVIGGISKSTAAAISYVIGPITGVPMFLLVRDQYVRFHAAQSVVVFGLLFVLQWILTVTVILVSLVPLLSVITFVLWLVLIYKAWMGEEWQVPILGEYSRKFTKKMQANGK